MVKIIIPFIYDMQKPGADNTADHRPQADIPDYILREIPALGLQQRNADGGYHGDDNHDTVPPHFKRA